ncbi:MAG: sugar transferase, partial [Chloroflexota bacterium]
MVRAATEAGALEGTSAAIGVTAERVPARHASLAVSERRLLLTIVDGILLLGVSAVAAVSDLGPGSFILMASSAIVGWQIAGQVVGLYDLATASRARTSAFAVLQVAAMAAGFLMLLFLVAPYAISRPKILILMVGAPAAISIWRYTYARLLGGPHFQRRVLIVGGGRSCKALLQAIRRYEGHGLKVVGILDDGARRLGYNIDGVPVLGYVSALWPVARQRGIEEIVLANEVASSTELWRCGLRDCYEQGIAVSLMPNVYEEVTGQVPVDFFGLEWLGAVSLRRPGGGVYVAIKRLSDAFVAGLALMVSLVPMSVIALLVWATSGRPIFYRQTRLGMYGREFDIIKFRTMQLGAEQPGEARWALVDDPRTTRIGHWLRKTHLDELPQLWLVLRGKMSLVGPRPERPEFIEQLE